MKDQSNTGKESLEPERSGGGKDSLPQYNSEVLAIPKRRRFTDKYKMKVIKEIERCKMSGGKGLILRREGLFSSQISQWKAQMGTSKKKKTNKSSDVKNENDRLKRENTRLKLKLEKSEKLIEIQKKMAKIMDELNDNESASE